MASLTGNTAGSLKKMLPPLKRRAAEVHPSFGVFLGLAVAAPTTSPTAAKSTTKKRKATNNVTKDVDDVDEPEAEPISAGNKSDGNKPDSKKKKVAAPKKASAKKAAPVKKPRGKKEAKKEDSGAEDNVKDKSGENSADGTDGTDGPGTFITSKNVLEWLEKTDEGLGNEVEDDI